MVLDIGLGLTSAEMVVIDAARVRDELAMSTDHVDRAVAAMAAKDFAGAARKLDLSPAGFRRDAMRRELARLEGRYDAAIACSTHLLEVPGVTGLRRAVLLQHLGKAELGRGLIRRPTDDLSAALELRQSLGAR